MATSSMPIVLREVDATKDDKTGAYKPAGFWYEVDGGWRDWCAGEGWNCGKFHMHSVELNDCNVLKIDTLKALDCFHQEFKVDRRGFGLYEIDWAAVARKYDGVEIAPYQYPRRFEFHWYYGWDCASGVIWRPKGALVTYVGEVIVGGEEKEVSV